MYNVQFSKIPPLSLYIHIPWCVKKCPYCDFNSHTFHQTLPEQEYINCLLKDLECDLEYVQNRLLESIFIGGGTPSLMTPKNIAFLLEKIAQKIQFNDNIEITLEANPGASEYSKFKDFKSAGINRLSIGVQSFQNDKLQQLGRIHDSEAAKQAILAAQKADFRQLNIDLMYGLPNQDTQQALSDLQTAIDFTPSHLSWYQLTIEPNTKFFSNPPITPNEDSIVLIEDEGKQLLNSNKYQQYEISAYCQPGQHCLHNINYWEFGDYLGIGAGAHSKITLLEQNKVLRLQKTRQPKDYLQKKTHFASQKKAIDLNELQTEFLMNALRLMNGTDEKLFTERTGLPLSMLQKSRQLALERGLLHDNQRLQATKLGQRYLNDLIILMGNYEIKTSTLVHRQAI